MIGLIGRLPRPVAKGVLLLLVGHAFVQAVEYALAVVALDKAPCPCEDVEPVEVDHLAAEEVTPDEPKPADQ